MNKKNKFHSLLMLLLVSLNSVCIAEDTTEKIVWALAGGIGLLGVKIIFEPIGEHIRQTYFFETEKEKRERLDRENDLTQGQANKNNAQVTLLFNDLSCVEKKRALNQMTPDEYNAACKIITEKMDADLISRYGSEILKKPTAETPSEQQTTPTTKEKDQSKTDSIISRTIAPLFSHSLNFVADNCGPKNIAMWLAANTAVCAGKETAIKNTLAITGSLVVLTALYKTCSILISQDKKEEEDGDFLDNLSYNSYKKY